jgi:hypothetical protein
MAQFGRGNVRKFFKGDPTLVGYWALNDGDGNVVKDLSKNNNYGTLTNGAVITNDNLFGKSCFFDGTNDYVNIPYNSDLQLTSTNFTILAWIYPTSNVQGGIIDKDNDGSCGWGFWRYSDGRLWFWYAAAQDKFSTGITPLKKWSFVCFTYNVNTLRGQFWINGNFDSDVAVGGIDTCNISVKIGSVRGASYQFFAGKISNVAVFRRLLSPQEIQSYYNWAISKSTPIIFTPRKNAAVLNVGEVVPSTIKARRGLIMSM